MRSEGKSARGRRERTRSRGGPKLAEWISTGVNPQAVGFQCAHDLAGADQQGDAHMCQLR